MELTKEEYARIVARHAPKSKWLVNMAKAFVAGGLICCVGQALTDGYGLLIGDAQTAKTAVSITMVFLGVLLTDLGLYDKLAKHAGAGTLVPITGFANSVAAPALDFKTEGLITGMAVKMFTIAGPVLVFGTAASVVYGLLLWAVGR